MPPFLQFRLWLRESPASEKAFAAAAALVALVLVVIALVPVATNDDDTLRVGGVAANGSTDTALGVGTGDSGGPVSEVEPNASAPGATRPSTATTLATRGGGAAAAESCDGLTASAPGVTPTQLLMDVSTISLAGPIGNSQFGIRPDLHEIATALADEVNKTGGVACGRKLVIKLYDVNPLDTNDAQAKCLQMVEDKPYIVMDFGGYLGQATRACFVQNKLPIISSVAFDAAEARGAGPYVVGPRNLAEDQARNAILGLKDRGFFDAPKFKKLGLIVENCLPAVAKEIDARLAQVGLKSSQISKYELGCNPAAAPNQIGQAVLQHKADGASHVFLAVANNNGQNYARFAASQAFRPQYGISDLGEGVTPSGARNWDPSFDGAIGITSTHTGEPSSGVNNAKVAHCDGIMKRHGVKGFSSEATDLALLAFCDLFDFFRGAANKAGKNPVRTSFASGIGLMGTYATASVGDAVYNRADKLHGGDYQRAIQFHTDCGCWKVRDEFKPAYPV